MSEFTSAKTGWKKFLILCKDEGLHNSHEIADAGGSVNDVFADIFEEVHHMGRLIYMVIRNHEASVARDLINYIGVKGFEEIEPWMTGDLFHLIFEFGSDDYLNWTMNFMRTESTPELALLFLEGVRGDFLDKTHARDVEKSPESIPMYSLREKLISIISLQGTPELKKKALDKESEGKIVIPSNLLPAMINAAKI